MVALGIKTTAYASDAAASSSEIDQVLADEHLLFSAHDFDEAFHHQLTERQELGAAEQLKEFKLWWDLLSGALAPSACGSGCSGCK